MLLKEAKDCFRIKIMICMFGARQGMIWTISSCFAFTRSAAVNSDFQIGFEN